MIYTHKTGDWEVILDNDGVVALLGENIKYRKKSLDIKAYFHLQNPQEHKVHPLTGLVIWENNKTFNKAANIHGALRIQARDMVVRMFGDFFKENRTTLSELYIRSLKKTMTKYNRQLGKYRKDLVDKEESIREHRRPRIDPGSHAVTLEYKGGRATFIPTNTGEIEFIVPVFKQKSRTYRVNGMMALSSSHYEIFQMELKLLSGNADWESEYNARVGVDKELTQLLKAQKTFRETISDLIIQHQMDRVMRDRLSTLSKMQRLSTEVTKLKAEIETIKNSL